MLNVLKIDMSFTWPIDIFIDYYNNDIEYELNSVYSTNNYVPTLIMWSCMCENLC